MEGLKLVLAKDLKVGQVVADQNRVQGAAIMKYRGEGFYQGMHGYFFEYVSGDSGYLTCKVPELDPEKQLIGFFHNPNEDFYEVN